MSGGTRSYEMARRLVAGGHTVDMITSRQVQSGGGWEVTDEDGIRVHWLPVEYNNRMGFSRRIRAFFEFAWAAGRRAASLDADVVFATSTPLTIALPAVYAARKLKVPMVFEVRDLWPELPIAVGALRNPLTKMAARWLESFAYRNATKLVALSPGMKDGIIRRGIVADRVEVVPNSCDNDLFNVPLSAGKAFRTEHGLPSDAPLVVYAGTLGQINGVEYIAELAARLATLKPEVRFLILGEGKREEAFKTRAQELGVLNRNLFMMPPVSKRNMPAVLSAANLALCTFVNLKQMWANSANKLFDALASGTPIAINYGGWQADFIRETGAGLVLPPEDLGLAAAEMAAFLGDSSRQRKAAAAARRLARDRFDRDQLAESLEKLLLTAISSYKLR